MRGATDPEKCNGAAAEISIHAPHAGSDNRIVNLANNGLISIHAPHAGSD